MRPARVSRTTAPLASPHAQHSPHRSPSFSPHQAPASPRLLGRPALAAPVAQLLAPLASPHAQHSPHRSPASPRLLGRPASRPPLLAARRKTLAPTPPSAERPRLCPRQSAPRLRPAQIAPRLCPAQIAPRLCLLQSAPRLRPLQSANTLAVGAGAAPPRGSRRTAVARRLTSDNTQPPVPRTGAAVEVTARRGPPSPCARVGAACVSSVPHLLLALLPRRAGHSARSRHRAARPRVGPSRRVSEAMRGPPAGRRDSAEDRGARRW
jgi:hypothetical protein